MAGSATQYTQQHVLSHTLAYGAMTAPPAVYLGLALNASPPDATTAGTPPSDPAYARQSAAFVLSATPNIAQNSATVAYPAATTAWGSVGYFEVFDAATAGNRLYWGPLVDPADGVTPLPRTVQVGDIVRFSAGTVQITAT
jgi:hypothetical protein